MVTNQVGTGGGRGRDAFAALAEASGLGSAALKLYDFWCFALLPVAGSRVACSPGQQGTVSPVALSRQPVRLVVVCRKRS